MDGMKSGQGKIVYPDGAVLEGKWEKDYANGKGVIKYSNGDSF